MVEKRRVPLGESKVGTLIVRLSVLVIALGLWVVAPQSILPDFAFGKPWEVAVSLWTVVQTGKIFPALLATFTGMFQGMVISFPLGVLLGLLCASRPLRWIIEPFVAIGYAVPKIGLVSLFIIAMGVSAATHIALVVSICTFVFYYSTRQALNEVDQNRVIAMRMMGASPLKIVRSLVLPSAVPQLFAATRIGLPLAFTVEVFSELVVPTSAGLGVMLQNFQNALNGAGAIAIMFVIAAIGYFMDSVLGGRLGRYSRSIGVGMK